MATESALTVNRAGSFKLAVIGVATNPGLMVSSCTPLLNNLAHSPEA